MTTVVIVGANLAGGAAATTLRAMDFDGRVVLVGSERHPPYERPPLSKGYLRGEEAFAATLLHPEPWYGDNGVELLLGTRAQALDLERRLVLLDEREALSYDRLLIATGGRNRRLRVPGADLEGIHQLRTVEEADALRADAPPGRRAVVVGAGFIGSEVAASLRALGVEVDVIEVLSAPLLSVLGPEVAAVYEAIHRDHGVRFHFGRSVASFEGTAGRVDAVVTDDGDRLPCDLAVVGVGIEPATELVQGTDLEMENGIVVDELCRTSAPDVFAAGDVANHWHPLFGRRVRVEHWDNALKQGAAAAKSMAGVPAPFDDPHWFWSDQYEHNLQYVGLAVEWDRFVVRGSLEERNFVGFYLKEGVVQAAIGLDRGKDVRRARDLIRSRRAVDPALLADEEADLRKLAASAGA